MRLYFFLCFSHAAFRSTTVWPLRRLPVCALFLPSSGVPHLFRTAARTTLHPMPSIGKFRPTHAFFFPIPFCPPCPPPLVSRVFVSVFSPPIPPFRELGLLPAGSPAKDSPFHISVKRMPVPFPRRRASGIDPRCAPPDYSQRL